MAKIRIKQVTIDQDVDLNSNKITNLAAGTSANDAVTKAQLDAQAAGLSWVDPVSTKDYLGTRTITEINALTPTLGESVVSGDAGTPSEGTSDALVAGSVAEFDGTSWKEIVTGSGGFVPDGTRLLVHDSGTLFSPLTDSTDEGKIAEFDGATNTPTFATTPIDGVALMVSGDSSVNENSGFTYNGTIPTGTWTHFTGLGQVTAGAGMSKSGNTLNVGDVNKGVQVNADDVEIDASEIVGNGLKVGSSSHLIDVEAENDSVSVGASGLKAAVPTTNDKDLTASVTSSDGDAASASAITTTPSGDGNVKVEVNGLGVQVGDGVKTKAAYFSSDGGTTAKAIAAIASGDLLYWNGSIAGYELDAADSIDFNYNVIV